MIQKILFLPRLILRYPLETAICGLLVMMTGTVFAQVVARYILQAPLSWSEELARFLLMWLSMLSAAYAFKTKSHFTLQLIVGMLREDMQKKIALGVQIVVILFFAVVLYASIIFVIGTQGHIAPALQIPMQIPYSSVILGSALMMYEAIREFWQSLRSYVTQMKAKGS